MPKNLPQTHCPKCKQKSINSVERRCTQCGARLFLADDGVPDHEPEGWFMWMRGPRGLGWYRDGFVKTTRNWPVAKSFVVALRK
jgi:hypothetical protein